MNRRSVSLLAATTLAAGLALSLPATAAPVPNDATWTEAYFPSDDGTVLHADVLLPKNRSKSAKHPVIVSIGPYFGTGSQGAPAPDPTNSGPSNRFGDLWKEGRIFEKGYAYVQVDSRGYGGSQGCNDFGGKGEQMDAKAAVEWAAKQSWSTGKVGMWGKSYDAWTQVMALSMNPKGLAATVIQSPINDGYKIAFENGVHWSSGWYVTPSLYHAYDLLPPTTSNSPEYWANWAQSTAMNPTCAGQNRVMTSDPNRTNPYWVERDIMKRAAASKVAVLWSHGFNDVNTKPTNIFEVYSHLKGPKRAWFGQWDHVRGNEADKVGREGFMDEAMNWFDHYLKGKPLKKLPAVEVQDGDGSWRSEQAWPARDAKMRTMPVKAGTYVDDDENSARTPSSGTWSVSQPAPYDVRISGLPKLTVKATTATPAGAPLIAQLYDVAPDNSSRLVTRGAYQLTNAEPASFDLWPTDWKLEKGHRLALQLTASDNFIYLPNNTRTTVTVVSGRLMLPILMGKRVSNHAGEDAQAMGGNVANPTMQKSWFTGRDVKADFGPRAR
jgi:predicted acyl esterase